MSIFETTTLDAAGITPGSPAGTAAETRANILDMGQAVEAAVLRPLYTGGLAHDLRAALAARIARLNGDEALALRYLDGAGDKAALADPAEPGAGREAVMLAFMDKVAARTRDVAAEDISALQAEGISDADIVKLCELNAFMAYQIRVIAGLRLMKGETA
ncbi:hypothetical protein [Salipiger sp.]|uniref:hypothetical protein n=1 Tax=Salipiger sp. TaxID=2078585 RepID=UPI003A98541C